MLKTDHPIVLNNVTYLPFKTWNVSYSDSVTTHETESGKQEDSVSRRGRRTISASTRCVATTAATLACLENLDEFDATFYDVKTQASITSLVRVSAGSMKVNLVSKSSDLDITEGLYDVSFKLEEF